MTGTQTMELVSPFRERIEPLLANYELGKEDLPGFNVGSNCHGTVLFVFNTENLLLIGQEPPRGIQHGSGEDCFFLLDDHTRPGYVGRVFMKRRLTDRRYVEETEKKPYVIAAFFDGRQELWHTGLYIGEYTGRSTFFHQANTNDAFGLSDIETYARVSMGKNYSIKYFRPRTRKI